MPQESRFAYVKYDARSVELQNRIKAIFEQVEEAANVLPPGRAKSLFLTSLEEAYMWIGKAIRDDQLQKRGGDEQPERKDG
jgi:hypothetical protein